MRTQRGKPYGFNVVVDRSFQPSTHLGRGWATTTHRLSSETVGEQGRWRYWTRTGLQKCDRQCPAHRSSRLQIPSMLDAATAAVRGSLCSRVQTAGKHGLLRMKEFLISGVPLMDIWGISSVDVFAVGLFNEIKRRPIFHYDGSAWSRNGQRYRRRPLWGLGECVTDVSSSGRDAVRSSTMTGAAGPP